MALTASAVTLASYVVLRLAAASPAVVVLAVALWGATFSVVAVSQQLAVLRLAGHGAGGETAAALNGAVFQGGIAAGSPPAAPSSVPSCSGSCRSSRPPWQHWPSSS